jgi:1,4-alpha-glucan branching enzyme
MTNIEESEFAVSAEEAGRLLRGEHHEPHSILGLHRGPGGSIILRTFHPDAEGCELLREGAPTARLEPRGRGLFSIQVEGFSFHEPYRLRFRFVNGTSHERGDPYRHVTTVSEMDLHLFGEGTHRQLYRALGARIMNHGGEMGTAFSVWAPNARRVSVVGDFCGWDGRLFAMRSLGASGVWELFIPGVAKGTLYKFEIKTQGGDLRLKTDPMAKRMELPPETASIVHDDAYQWGDQNWLAVRATKDHVRSPINIYELHLGSWARN